MNLCNNLRYVLRPLEILGLLHLQKRRTRAEGIVFEATASYSVIVKFIIGVMCTLLGTVYMIVHTFRNYHTMAARDGAWWPMVYIVHSATFCVVLCILPWQTFRQRARLATVMNILQHNEMELQRVTGGATEEYRTVSLLATVILWNGIIFHIIFHIYFIYIHYGQDRFLESYIVSCFFLYVDFTMEFLMGMCSCLLLIARIQLARVVRFAKKLDGYENPERLMELYVRLYHRIVGALGEYMTPYFGPVILPYCTYVCFECAATIMEITETIMSMSTFFVIVCCFLWPLNDIKKLGSVLVISDCVNATVSDHFHSFYTLSFSVYHTLVRKFPSIYTIPFQMATETCIPYTACKVYRYPFSDH